MQLSKIESNLLIDEEVTQKIMTEIETMSDPSFLLMGIFRMVIDFYLIGKIEKSDFWENSYNIILNESKNKYVENEVDGFNQLYLYPFIFSLKREEPDFNKLSQYYEEYKNWAKKYYKKKISKEVNESFVLCEIILKKNIKDYSEETSLSKRYIQYVYSNKDNSVLQSLKAAIIRRMKNEGGLHSDSVLYLMAYYVLCDQAFTLSDYKKELCENEFLECV